LPFGPPRSSHGAWPGDLIIADEDGVVVVPPEAEAELARKAQARVEKEATMLQRLRQGERTVDLLGLIEADENE
jgi:4-hydroxy-4-methyl-2-oxoglutarate aldolase